MFFIDCLGELVLYRAIESNNLRKRVCLRWWKLILTI